jgi:hypothetical protein
MREESIFASLPNKRCIQRISYNANGDTSDDYENVALPLLNTGQFYWIN